MWQNFIRGLKIKFASSISISLLILWYVHYITTRPRPIVEPKEAEQAWQSEFQTESPKDSNIAESPTDKPRIRNAPSTRTQLTSSLASLGGKIQELRVLRSQVGGRLEDIQNSEPGRRIAASSEHFPLLMALIQHQADSEGKVNQIADRYSELVAAEVSGMTEVEHRETLGLLPEFEDALARATKEFHDVELALGAIESVTVSFKPANRTARESIADIQRMKSTEVSRRTKEFQLEFDASKKKAIGEAESELQHLEKQRAAAKVQLQNLKLLENQPVPVSNKDAVEAAKVRRAKLESEFQREKRDIEKYLASLIADGYKQPENSGYQSRSSKFGPVSLTKLRACGALNNTKEGLRHLAFAMTYANDRPSPGVQQFTGNFVMSDNQSMFFNRAMELLQKYQFLLVEKGLLEE